MSECNHDRYRGYPYAQANAAWQALRRGEVCYLGPFINTCEDCGADLTKYRIRLVMNASDYIKTGG